MFSHDFSMFFVSHTILDSKVSVEDALLLISFTQEMLSLIKKETRVLLDFLSSFLGVQSGIPTPKVQSTIKR